MLDSHTRTPKDETRVLALVSHQHYPALAVLDRFGLVPRRGAGRRLVRTHAHWSWDLRLAGAHPARADELVARVRKMIARYRPAFVVVGIPSREGALGRAVRAQLAAILREEGLPLIVRRVATAARVILGDIRQTIRMLARTIHATFFPELDPSEAHGRRHRYRWYVLAVALVELARRHPRSAAALLHREVPAFVAFIQRHELRLRPEV